MGTKHFLYGFCVTLLVTVILFSLFTVVFDPLFQYHKPWFGFEPVVTNERYQNAGIAKNFEFETAIIGNSMSENFRMSWFNQKWGDRCVKLSASGSHMLDWTYLLKILEKRSTVPKRIVVQLSPGELVASPKILKHDMPIFLYDDLLFNDVEYLLNIDISLDFTVPMIETNLAKTLPDIDEAYVWDTWASFGREAVLDGYAENANNQFGIDENIKLEAEDYLPKNAEENIRLIMPFIQNMKETEFVVWIPPYSILFWNGVLRDGQLNAYRLAYKKATDMLLQQENVKILFWNDAKMMDIITDLDNYKDSSHYSGTISKRICDRITGGVGMISSENSHEAIDEFFSFLEAYDYDSIL